MTCNPSFLPAAMLAAGIAVSAAAGTAWWIGIVPVAAALALYFFIMMKSGNPVAAFRLNKWHSIWIAFLFLGIGMLDESLSRPFGIDITKPAVCEVTGVLSKTYGDRIDLLIRKSNGTRAQIRSGATELSPGDIVEIPAGVLVGIEGDTSAYAKKTAPMLKAKGILYTGWVPAALMQLKGHSGALRYKLADIREAAEIRIERSRLAKPTAAFVNAILMGDKTGLDSSLRATFANGGTAHMLALSGLHMGIIAGLFLWLTFPLRALGRYKWGYGASIAALWAYVVLTGMSPSSTRACIMLTLAFVAVMLERKNSAAAALSSACLLILIVSPRTLFDAGFQLSVVCVGALIAFATRLNPIDHRTHPMLFRLCEALLATMTATAASWALISYYFGQIPLMFLPANLLLLPLLPVYLAVAAIYSAALCAGIEIHVAGLFLDHGYNFLIWATETLSGESRFVVDYQIPLYGACAWLAALATAAHLLNRKPKST